MNITPEDIRRNYAQLSDDELRAIDRASLTQTAQRIYDLEFSARSLTADGELVEEEDVDIEEVAPTQEDWAGVALEDEAAPEWIEDAAVACSFSVNPRHPEIGDVVAARMALQAAGIPCHITGNEVEATEVSGAFQEYCVMVPGALTLPATAVIDKAIFNRRQEEIWKTHLEALSDEELGGLNPDVFCSGLLDRVARLRRAYNEEVARRSQ